jgi:hypothetical protein
MIGWRLGERRAVNVGYDGGDEGDCTISRMGGEGRAVHMDDTQT